jgi:hypothetical protein
MIGDAGDNELVTFVVLIGNSDDKLSQRDWGRFVFAVVETAELHAESVEFTATSEGSLPWQNACVVFTAGADAEAAVRSRLSAAARDAGQDSIALIVGTTEFVAAAV